MTNTCASFGNRSEAQIENLWIPVDSSAVVNKVWKKEHFKEAIRVQAAMLSHDNDVLTPEALLKVDRYTLISGENRAIYVTE